MPPRVPSSALVAAPPSPLNPQVPVVAPEAAEPAKIFTSPVAFTSSRTMQLAESEMKTLPDGSTNTSIGSLNTTLCGRTPIRSVGKVGLPFPATVLILPPTVNWRTRFFTLSATYMLPELANATACGPERQALVAKPPSPQNPAVPLPAIVLMLPPMANWRTQLCVESEKVTVVPAPWTATPWYCRPIVVRVATPVGQPVPAVPVPAMVLMIRVEAVTSRIRQLSRSPRSEEKP